MTFYESDLGSKYSLHEVTFPNPVTGADTVLFVLVNESGFILRASTATWDVNSWMRDFSLELS